MQKIKLGALTVYGELKVGDKSLSNEIGPITNINGTHVIDYSTTDYHRLSSKGDTTLVVSNIPIGSLLVVYIDNTLGYNIVFGSTELLTSDDNGCYHILFGNPVGSPVVIGKPSQVSE